MLVALDRIESSGRERRRVRCVVCSAERVVLGYNLRNGHTRSCPCDDSNVKRRIATKHGESIAAGNRKPSPEYQAWVSMRHRCETPSNRMFPEYGGRGITVCQRWHTFENFLADMGRRPSPEHSIDRRDNNGNYEPSNCRWATRVVQMNNRRVTTMLTFDGVTLPLTEWARRAGVRVDSIRVRLKNGWSVERALTEPMQRRSA